MHQSKKSVPGIIITLLLFLSFLAAGLLILPKTSFADDLKICMTEMLDQVDDSVTIG